MLTERVRKAVRLLPSLANPAGTCGSTASCSSMDSQLVELLLEEQHAHASELGRIRSALVAKNGKILSTACPRPVSGRKLEYSSLERIRADM